MGQIVKRKKKGRPSKADLAAETKDRGKKGAKQPAADRELRRSGRRRNVKYTFDFDDYLDDDEYNFVDEEEDERRREKKLKLLLKLHGATSNDSPQHRSRSVHDAPPSSPPMSASSSSDEDNSKPSKKRQIDGDEDDENDCNGNGDGLDEDDYENDDVDDDDNNDNNNEDDDGVEVKRSKRGEPTKEMHSAPGTPLEPPSGFPLPDKKILEVVIDKLQKKDIYGVYAEPVDPDELPDYHDVIEHPMDFSTIRRKLANGSYATLEELENDVYLLCSNAMQYNAPDTIYYKQARSIQELAKKKFEKLRVSNERSENQMKLEQKSNPNSVVKKHIRRQMGRTVQESVGSDFSSGATLATVGDLQNGSSAMQAGGSERLGSIDGLVEGNLSVIDTSVDKVEESLPGKGHLARFGRKLSICDENRRATFNPTSQREPCSESIFSTFDGESKQLIPVGLYVDHSYARSLARFAGTLGPVAWKVASKRIEQVLAPGTKFGRGWVGEYEPLPTPVLMLQNCSIKEPSYFKKPQHTEKTTKDQKKSITPAASKDSSVTGPTFDEKLPISSSTGVKVTTSSSTTNLPTREPPSVNMTNLEGKPFLSSSPGTTMSGSSFTRLQHQNSQPKSSIGSEKKVPKQVELNCPPGPPSINQSSHHLAMERQVSTGIEVLTPRSVEMVSMNRNLLQSGSFKQPNVNAIAGVALPNGKVISNTMDNGKGPTSSSSDTGKVGTYFPQAQEQGLSDPVQLMRMLTEKNQSQQGSSNQSAVNATLVPPSQGLNREDPGNAAAAAARAWMSIGSGGYRPVGVNMSPQKNQISADSLYNPTRDMQSQVSRFRGDFPPAVHFQTEKNSFPFHAFAPQPVKIGNAAQFQNQPMVFPQLLTADLSRFQVQSPWRSVSPQIQQGKSQETLPPDLNVSFQSSGSPGRSSSGVLVDSQQPDLALQL